MQVVPHNGHTFLGLAHIMDFSRGKFGKHSKEYALCYTWDAMMISKGWIRVFMSLIDESGNKVSFPWI